MPSTPEPLTPGPLRITRRRSIGALGLIGAGLLGAATPAGAFLSKASSADVSGLPAEWVRRQGSNLQAYIRYIDGLQLKQVTALQVIAAHAKAKGSVWNMLPPRAWWSRMAATLRVLDRVAVELKQPVQEIVSAYRSPAYNARCLGAAKGSWHQANVALDVKFPVSASKVTATARKLRDHGLFKGGVGSYPGFTHIDTRGTNSNW